LGQEKAASDQSQFTHLEDTGLTILLLNCRIFRLGYSVKTMAQICNKTLK